MGYSQLPTEGLVRYLFIKPQPCQRISSITSLTPTSGNGCCYTASTKVFIFSHPDAVCKVHLSAVSAVYVMINYFQGGQNKKGAKEPTVYQVRCSSLPCTDDSINLLITERSANVGELKGSSSPKRIFFFKSILLRG